MKNKNYRIISILLCLSLVINVSPNVLTAIDANAVADAASNFTETISTGGDSGLENLNNTTTNSIEDSDTEGVTENEDLNGEPTSVPQMLYYAVSAAVEVDSIQTFGKLGRI